MIIKCSTIYGTYKFLTNNKMCKTQTIKEDIVVTNAASSNTGNNNGNTLSEWQIIGITLIIGMTLYILYNYIKIKITKKLTEAVARQAPL